MSKSHPPPPRGVDACIEALKKRRDWVAARDGGGYDTRERIALSYALGLLEAAVELQLVGELEDKAISQGLILEKWIDPLTREETEDEDWEEEGDLPAG